MRQPLSITAYDIAQRFVGIAEVNGAVNNPAILAMLRLDSSWVNNDEVPWCSAFVNYVAWLLRLPRSKSLAARSWLLVGMPVNISEAEAAFDVVVLKRSGDKSGPEIIKAPGHVGFYAGFENGRILVLGGNQGDQVSIAQFHTDTLLGIRRL